MKGVSAESLKWALEKLRESAAKAPRVRYRQTIYRLLLLHELGVTERADSPPLSSNAFTLHCQRFLLVSGGALASRTGGESYYFNPLSVDYLKTGGDAGSGKKSGWPINTLWTRSDVWAKNGVLAFDIVDGEQRRYRFLPDYVEVLAKEAKGDLLPALPLAVFLFRNPQQCNVSLDAVSDESDLLQLFLDTFRLTNSKATRLFDLTLI